MNVIMIIHMIYVSFLLYTFSSCETLITARITEMTEFEHVRVEKYSDVLVRTASVLQCAIECAINLKCESLSYHSGKGMCHLHPFLISNDTAEVIVGEDGWKSYKKCAGGCPTHCGYVYNETLEWCFRFVNEIKLKPNEAATFCRLDGSRMIRINSQERQLHVMDLLYSMEQRGVWIGGHSVNKDNVFVYEDGTPLLYFNWEANSPQFRSYIRITASRNYSWEDSNGFNARAFMCER